MGNTGSVHSARSRLHLSCGRSARTSVHASGAFISRFSVGPCKVPISTRPITPPSPRVQFSRETDAPGCAASKPCFRALRARVRTARRTFHLAVWHYLPICAQTALAVAGGSAMYRPARPIVLSHRGVPPGRAAPVSLASQFVSLAYERQKNRLTRQNLSHPSRSLRVRHIGQRLRSCLLLVCGLPRRASDHAKGSYEGQEID